MKPKDLISSLEQGIETVKTSGRWAEWLRVCSVFHTYSHLNTFSILIHRPTATRVAGFHTWIKLGRAVRKGEKGIPILAPMRYRKNGDDDGDDDDDPEYGLTFKTVFVFDVSQTDGRDLPTIADPLVGDDRGLYGKLAEVARGERIMVSRERKATGANGYYRRDGSEIWIDPDLGPAMSAKVLAHELGHHFAAHDQNGDGRKDAEAVAESAAFIVMDHFGFGDVGEYSFGYLATWTEPKAIRSLAGRITKTARTIIDRATA